MQRAKACLNFAFRGFVFFGAALLPRQLLLCQNTFVLAEAGKTQFGFESHSERTEACQVNLVSTSVLHCGSAALNRAVGLRYAGPCCAAQHEAIIIVVNY